MPFTLRRSSGFWKGASLRYSMIARAFAGPTPGSFARPSAPAELMSTRAPAAAGAAPAATAPRPVPASTSPQRSPTTTALVIRCIFTSFGAPAAPLAARRAQATCQAPRVVAPKEFAAGGDGRCVPAQRNVAAVGGELFLPQHLCKAGSHAL